eukprot:354727-Chlamydomonas_euryale.AAC.6
MVAAQFKATLGNGSSVGITVQYSTVQYSTVYRTGQCTVQDSRSFLDRNRGYAHTSQKNTRHQGISQPAHGLPHDSCAQEEGRESARCASFVCARMSWCLRQRGGVAAPQQACSRNFWVRETSFRVQDLLSQLRSSCAVRTSSRGPDFQTRSQDLSRPRPPYTVKEGRSIQPSHAKTMSTARVQDYCWARTKRYGREVGKHGLGAGGGLCAVGRSTLTPVVRQSTKTPVVRQSTLTREASQRYTMPAYK